MTASTEVATSDRKMKTTEMREIKALIKTNFTLLRKELTNRRDGMEQAINQEAERRQDAARVEWERAVKAIEKRIASLNETIASTVKDINDKGVIRHHSRAYRRDRDRVLSTTLKPSDFRIVWDPPVSNLYVGDMDDLEAARTQINHEYYAAIRHLERLEYETTKDAVLEWMSSEAAIDHVKALPTVDALLAVPPALEGVELPS